MADFIAITFQAEVRGRQIWVRKFNVWRGTKVPVLRELVEDVFHAKGTLSYQEKNIHQKMGTLDELQVGNGAVLKIKNYQNMSNETLKAIVLKILPQEERFSIEIPQKIKVHLFKFLIECKQKLLIRDQALNKGFSQRWEEDANAFYECTREELQELEVEDVSRRQNTLPHYPMTDNNNSQGCSPKTNIKVLSATECENKRSIGTEKRGSDPNLDDGEDRVNDAITATKGGATKQELKYNPKISMPQYLPRRPARSDRSDVAAFPSTKKARVLAPPQ